MTDWDEDNDWSYLHEIIENNDSNNLDRLSCGLGGKKKQC